MNIMNISWIPTKLHFFLPTSHSKVTVHFILQYFLLNQNAIPLKPLELYRLRWFSPFSKAFVKIYYFLKCHCHIIQIYIATSFEPTEFVRAIFRRLFEDTTITTNFLKIHICKTSFIEINTLLAIFNNKGLVNFKNRPNHSILKGMNAVQWNVFSSINAMQLVMQNYQKMWLSSRNTCANKNSSSEERAAQKN